MLLKNAAFLKCCPNLLRRVKERGGDVIFGQK